VKTQWFRTDQRWYLGVNCRRCDSPILFAVDYSENGQNAQTPPAGKLVLTCTIGDCKHKADYTGAVVLRLQKLPTDNETIGITANGKSAKVKA
jgi:hypothetical protein